MPFRSETMSFCQLIIPKETIFQTLAKLGKLGMVQFINLNERLNPVNLPYTAEIRDLNEIERQLRNIYMECEEIKVNVPKIGIQSTPPTVKEINEISVEIDKLEKSIEEISNNAKLLEKVECNLLETKFVLEFCHDFFSSAGLSITRDSLTKELLHDATITLLDFPPNDISRLEYLTGTVPIRRKYAFERMLWRVCKGNFCITYSKIHITSYDSCFNSTSQVEKVSFFIFFHGEAIKAKILKICEGFHCNLIHCPDHAEDRNEIIQELWLKIGDINLIVSKTEAQKLDMLRSISEKLYPSLVKIKTMQEIYFIMNQLSIDHSNLFYLGKLYFNICVLLMDLRTYSIECANRLCK